MPSPHWRTQGREPDYRFSLANERTFLAWVRTALALLAGGVLLDQFASRLHPPAAALALAVLLCAMSAAVCVLSYRRWRANEIAMRHDRPLPPSPAMTLLVGGVASMAGVIGLMLLLR
jgi:putative membrane protein